MSARGRNSTYHQNEVVFLREGSYTVKNLRTEEERYQAYDLRHSIFSRELRWTPYTDNLRETDEFDNSSIFFGVSNREKKLIGFMRLIPPENTFMIETTFSFLLEPSNEIRKDRDVAELSRLCIAPHERQTFLHTEFGGYTIAILLYKGVYHWCVRNGIRYVYFVTEHRIYRLMREQGFPCAVLGGPVKMPDGVIALSAGMDWQEFEKTNAERRPKLLKWFNQGLSGPAPGRLQRLESC